jgi:N-hydroxyarylamine O-acetyltransferase
MTALDLDAYLARIGHAGSRAPTLETLTALHAAHVASIPFENLDPLLGRPVRLDSASLQAKLVHGGRGGYCYEHNLLLADALQQLGFKLRHLAARVTWGVDEGIVRPRTHMLLMVEIDRQRFIADVGFGGMTLDAPLRLDEAQPQSTPHGRFRLAPQDEDFILQAAVDDGWRPLYRFDLQAQQRVDYELSSWYLCHHPDSFFRQSLTAARIGPEGRQALLDNRLSLYPPAGEARISLIDTAAGLRATLETRFGIDSRGLDGIESLLQRLASRTQAPTAP